MTLRSPASRDVILRRLEEQAVRLNRSGLGDGEFDECKYFEIDKFGRKVKQPRWRIDEKWIEFECGCRAERCMKLYGMKPWDPVIFVGLPEQAVYDFVCHTHNASMNVRLMRNYVDFAQWHRERRNKLMGK